jgi:hypothetical protein
MSRARRKQRSDNVARSTSKTTFFALTARIEPWLEWWIAGVYLAMMGFLTFRYHPVGGLQVETDFYAELVPQAQALMSGAFDPGNYGAKGPVYSVLLSATYIAARDWFRAGVILNLLASAVFLVACHRLLARLFNRTTAHIAILAIATNYTFQSFTCQAASDMPFMALSVLAIYFVFDERRSRGTIVIAALCASLAFLTRYNGAFLVVGSLAYLSLVGDTSRRRMRDAALWLAVFIVSGLPWYIPNALATGSPIHNDNALSVAMEFYGVDEDGFNYERWTENLPEVLREKIEQSESGPDISIMDVARVGPGHFVAHLALNTVRYFLAHLSRLIGWRLGVFVLAGIGLFWFARPGRRRMLFFLFGAVLFMILTLIFFNERFALFLLVFYLPIAIWPFTTRRVRGLLRGFSMLPVILMGVLIASYAVTSTPRVVAEMKRDVRFLTGLKDLGLALGAQTGDSGALLAARKPHVAHYAGMYPIMFPPVGTVAELRLFCREHDVGYVLYSGVEIAFRPEFRALVQFQDPPPGLVAVVSNHSGVVYRILEDDGTDQ